MRKIVLIIIFSFTVFFINSAFGIEVGDTAPDFTISTLSNGQISLSQFNGKVVYLYFLGWGCPPCLAPTGGLATEFSIWQVYKNQNFQTIGIDCWDGTVAQMQNFQFNTGITYPLGLNGGNICADYLAPASFSVIVDQSGIVSYVGLAVDLPKITNTIDSLLGITFIEEKDNKLNDFNLLQNYPNPFNPSTTIEYSIPVTGLVTIKVFNLVGQEIAVLVSEVKSPGLHQLKWDASLFPGGVYFYRFESGGLIKTRKLILLK